MKKVTCVSLCDLPVAMALTALTQRAPSSDAYSEQQKSTAMSVDLARRRISTLGERCLSRLYSADTLRFVLHLTKIKNMDVTLPADKVLLTLTPVEQRLRDEVDAQAADTSRSGARMH